MLKSAILLEYWYHLKIPQDSDVREIEYKSLGKKVVRPAIKSISNLAIHNMGPLI